MDNQKQQRHNNTRHGATAEQSAREFVVAAGIVVIGFVLYEMLRRIGAFGSIDPTGSRMTIGIALLVGVVASFSSCLAVVGGVVLAFGETYKGKGAGIYAQTIRPNVLFHAGRLGTFFVLGGTLGALGGQLRITGTAVAVMHFAIALVMLWLGLNILGLVPSITRLVIRTPEGFSRRWHALSRSNHAAMPLLIGGMTFFLPCGFTQSMQIFALASGSFWIGGLSLLLFSIGTMPVLLALGITSAWSRANNITLLKKIAGMAIVLFAVFSFNSAWALKGVNMNVLEGGTGYGKEAAAPAPSGAVQEIRMKITANGFEPAVIHVEKGIPVKWIIDQQQIGGCTNRIIVPSMQIVKDVDKGENVVYFTPQTDGAIPFSCWMGMVRGTIISE